MRVLVFSANTKSLIHFRLDMMKCFNDNGCEVYAIGEDESKETKEFFSSLNIKYFSAKVSRNGMNPLKDYRYKRNLKRIIESIRPDKTFVYQAKPIVYGIPVLKKMGFNEIYPMMGGLGSIFRGKGLKNKLLRKYLSFKYRKSFSKLKTIIFQNDDDIKLFKDLRIINHQKTEIINGSGVNTKIFEIKPMPEKPCFLFVGRLLRDKGIIEYLKACECIKKAYPEIKCMLVGPFDSNPSSIQQDELDYYIKNNYIEYYGEQSDVRSYIERCSTFVLPSYHEGTPKSILEAMSIGRCIITTNVPGCKETTINGVNGIVVDVANVDELLFAMKKTIEDYDLCKDMAKKSGEIARNKYDVEIVNKQILRIMKI